MTSVPVSGLKGIRAPLIVMWAIQAFFLLLDTVSRYADEGWHRHRLRLGSMIFLACGTGCSVLGVRSCGSLRLLRGISHANVALCRRGRTFLCFVSVLYFAGDERMNLLVAGFRRQVWCRRLRSPPCCFRSAFAAARGLPLSDESHFSLCRG